ncbi:DNA-directed RNA polymerase subunit L [Candidatus Micrarchaeota archaeon]|nr:DNA-directed RNA polymerase subunit L [Candidatus Micrarchaeota archaeon]
MKSASVIKDEKDYLEFVLEQEDVGFTNLLVEKLLQNSDVTFAASSYDHPLKGNAVVKIRGKNPKKSLHKAIDESRKELKELESLADKKLK